MRLRSIALALAVGLVMSATAHVVFSQEASPQPSLPGLGEIPNPFRTPDSLDTLISQPSFDETNDRNLLSPSTPNNRPSENRRSTPTPVSTSQNSRRNNSPFSPRLARAAPIMGDSFAPGLQLKTGFDTGSGNLGLPSVSTSTFEADQTCVHLPQGGGASRAKIAENSAALPRDRFIFNYNHFHNAVDSQLTNGTNTFNDSSNVDRFTLGFERTFFSSLCSIDLRIPLSANNDISTSNFSRNGSELGNLAVSLKCLLASDDSSALAGGITFDFPTGESSSVRINGDTSPLMFSTSNEAFHLAPFLGFLIAQGKDITHQGFLQVDVPTSSNRLRISDINTPTIEADLLEQTLLFVDYSFAKDVYNAGRSARGGLAIQRVTGLAELHYTTTLEDSDVVQLATTLTDFQVMNVGNRLDVVNLTLGLQTELSSGTTIRLGTVAPITDGDDRFFDVEFQAQLNVPL